MEEGRWDEANAEKQRLEEKQRIARREREREAANQRTSSQSEEGESCVSVLMLYYVCIPPYMGIIMAIRGKKKISCDPLFSSKSCRWGLSYWPLPKKQVPFVLLPSPHAFISLPNYLCMYVFFQPFCWRCISLFQMPLMTATRHFGLRAARMRSQVSKSISIREATGKPRNVAAGSAAQTYFDLSSDCKVPWRDRSIKAAWCTAALKACLPPPAWMASSFQWLSVLRDLQAGHFCLIQRESRVFSLRPPSPPTNLVPVSLSLSIYPFVAVTHLRGREWKFLCCCDSGQAE